LTLKYFGNVKKTFYYFDISCPKFFNYICINFDNIYRHLTIPFANVNVDHVKRAILNLQDFVLKVQNEGKKEENPLKNIYF